MDFLARKRLYVPVICALLGLVAGCSAPAVGPRPVVQDDLETHEKTDPSVSLKEEMARLLAAAPGPPPFEEKLEPVKDEILEETKLFSLTFDEAPLGGVLSALVHDTDLNLSVESGVDLDRPGTVHLKTVTFVEALNMPRESLCLNCWDGDWPITE